MGWMAGWLAGELGGGLVGWLVGCLAGWFFGWLAGWLGRWLVGWLVGWLLGGLAGCLAGWLVGWLVGWPTGRLVGCLSGWLTGWLVWGLELQPRARNNCIAYRSSIYPPFCGVWGGIDLQRDTGRPWCSANASRDVSTAFRFWRSNAVEFQIDTRMIFWLNCNMFLREKIGRKCSVTWLPPSTEIEQPRKCECEYRL